MRIDLDEVCSCPPASLGENSPLREIGRSREGRPLPGATLGDGPLRISLIAGAHADEPVGPRALERLITWLAAGTGTMLPFTAERVPSASRCIWIVMALSRRSPT